MQAYLQKEFRLPLEQVARLRCVGRGGSFAGYPVTFIRIFDGVKAHVNGHAIKCYRDLDRHLELTLFEGQVYRDGKVYLEKKKAATA